MRVRPLIGLVALLAAGAPVALTGQDVWDPGRIQMTRTDLGQLLVRLEQAANSSTYTQPVRDRARAEAGAIRTRLAEGDFQVGDRITLLVEGEPTLTDTFTVRDGRRLRLPVIGDISLAGVLRAELEAHLQTALAKFVRDPVVRARSLIRLSFLGDVAKPGFYVVPTDMVLSDALMLAGGPNATAKLDRIRVEREGQAIWGEVALRQAMAEGRTVDQLSLRAGDQVVLPKRTPINWQILVSVPVAIFGLVQLFR
jgi:polysaccharide export outer membrane protein